MNRLLHHAAFVLGLAAVAWVAAGYIPAHPLALALVLPIAATYVIGAFELHRFQQATVGLSQAVASTTEPPPALGPWLARLPAGLQAAVRLRVDGERVALPGPALTPYLTGLLVLLGMLGPFLGMVVTLQGTGLALENATDVEAIRASLAAPVKGLGLAFGTSVAGVAASAMLGLMSALVRRERQRVLQQLDARIAGPLRGFSQAQQREQHREELLRLQRLQVDAMGQALPALVGQIQGLAERLDRQGQALNQQLLASQDRFQGEAQRAYAGLAASVDRSLKDSLSESARLAGAAIQPAVQATMAQLGRESARLHDALSAAVQQQIDGVGARLDRSAEGLLQRIADTVQRQNLHDAQLIGELRSALGDSLVRDNAVLDERNRLMATLAGLLDTLNHASSEQRSAIDALVRATTGLLDRAGTRFADSVDTGSRTLQAVSAQLSGSAAEVASLGEGFGLAVQLFSTASQQLMAQLQRIEGALGQSMARSDEQLAYYVAQAREIIDLTLGSQKQIVDDLQQLARVPARRHAEADAA